MKIVTYSVLVVSFFLLQGQNGNAISRHNAGSLTCSGAKELIKSEGAVLLKYPARNNPGLTLSDRFVKNTSQCRPGEVTFRKSVPTSDNKTCRLRYCKPKYISN